jgi:hypothetical protein
MALAPCDVIGAAGGKRAGFAGLGGFFNAGEFVAGAGATPGSRGRLRESYDRRVSAVVPEAHRCVVFGTVDLGDPIGNRNDQGGLGRILPLAARRLAKMGRAAPKQFIA